MLRKLSVAVVLLGSVGTGAWGAEIANPSFELDTYTVWPGYTGGNGGVLTGWTATGTGNTTDPAGRSGINSNPPTWNPANTSPFGNNGIYPDGTQVGFIQAFATPTVNTATTTLSNTITGLTPGETYRLTFGFNARAGQSPNGTVTVGGNSLNFRATSVEGANARTLPFRTASVVFTATGPTETLSLSNSVTAGTANADTTLDVDNFQIAPGSTKWRSSAWADDASSGINPTSTYSHAYNLASPVGTTINGVNFTGVDGGNPAVPGSFSTTGWTTAIGGDDANDLTAAGGGGAELARRFVYGGASQTAQTLTITGLTPGVPNHLILYGVGWSDAGAIARSATFSDGAGDALTMNEHMFGVDKGVKIEFDYVPTGTSQTFTLNPTAATTTFHLYGFANEVVPEPSALAIVGLGMLVANRRRRRA